VVNGWRNATGQRLSAINVDFPALDNRPAQSAIERNPEKVTAFALRFRIGAALWF
jgi:hypothetical protein